MKNIRNITFNDFLIYTLEDYTSIFHIQLSDTPEFYNALFDYFFDEQRLINYIENKKHLKFDNTKFNYVSLYKHLEIYIDDCNEEIDLGEFNDEISKILQNEYSLDDKRKGNLSVRPDKMGKIGELIFSNILSEYFQFDCIIPKCSIISDKNMNVFGIDTLYYSEINDMILFGESKLSKSLVNGVKLIKESLKSYESNIKEEFKLIFSSRMLQNNFGKFGDRYKDMINQCMSVTQFIKLANIDKIGIPIFIAHGENNNVSEIFRELKKIQKDNFLGINTNYFIISLPIINKSKLIATFTKQIREKRAYYERACDQ